MQIIDKNGERVAMELWRQTSMISGNKIESGRAE